MKYVIIIVGAWAILISISGCATYKTLESTSDNSPVFFSGTLLDLNAINKNKIAIKKHKVDPPKHPLLDLPASFILDVIVSPATAIMALTGTLAE